ncbi:MAG: hypothetical protein HYY23_14035 [Verrucomicrobia bacterium]|nr:hypothetical protein [Verrucomicrobiota bacterium]
MMKALLSTIMLITITSACVVSADDPAISVSIITPQLGHGERRITYRNSGTEWDRTAHFHAIVSNRSDKPQKIWQEWCSWGYWALSFEFTDKSGKQWTAKKRSMKPFTMNAPAFWVLEPQESIVLEVYFADPGIWEGFPLPEEGSKVVGSMRAVFEIRSTPESAKHVVWTGRVISEARRITFYLPKK